MLVPLTKLLSCHCRAKRAKVTDQEHHGLAGSSTDCVSQPEKPTLMSQDDSSENVGLAANTLQPSLQGMVGSQQLQNVVLKQAKACLQAPSPAKPEYGLPPLHLTSETHQQTSTGKRVEIGLHHCAHEALQGPMKATWHRQLASQPHIGGASAESR